MKKIASLLSVSVLLIISSCNGTEKNQILTGADQPELYKPLLEDKAVGIVANQTSITGGIHLVDMLVNMGIDVQVIFAPEHGFRDLADAGESIEDGKDETTGITVTSLYGSHFKPTPEDLKDIDVVVFDIQDVGARFYTYISTLHCDGSLCGKQCKCIVLDRPNPNGYYFDGNIADTAGVHLSECIRYL